MIHGKYFTQGKCSLHVGYYLQCRSASPQNPKTPESKGDFLTHLAPSLSRQHPGHSRATTSAELNTHFHNTLAEWVPLLESNLTGGKKKDRTRQIVT